MQNKIKWRLLAGMVLLVLLLVVGFVVGSVGVTASSAYTHAQAAAALVDDGVRVEALSALQRHLAALAEDTARLEQMLRPLAPLLQGMEDVRLRGVQVSALPAYVSALSQSAGLVADYLALVRAYPIEPGQALPRYLLLASAAQAGAIANLSPRAQQVQAALLALDAQALPPAWAAPFAQMQPLAALLEPALQVLPALSALLGYGDTAHYLVLVQNNHEARASGGFISGVSLLTLNDGEIGDLAFSDSYAVDNLSVAHPAAPPAMQRYLDAPLIFLRDANWSPHFPISARTAQAIYVRDQGIAVDGVISVDLHALELLLQAIGPIEVTAWDEPVTAANVQEVMMTLWAAPATTDERIGTDIGAWWMERKSFMGLLAAALLAEIQWDRVDDLAVLGPALYAALQTRAIQVWVDDAAVAQHLARWGWDGALHTVEGMDYLAVIDSNVGFNKVNAVVERSVGYAVNWEQGGGQAAQATVTLTYTHPLTVPGHLCNRRAYYGENYQEMMQRCFFNYVRVYTPRGSELVSTLGLAEGTQESQSGEANTTVFGGYFELAPGSTHTVQFTYRLPASLQPDSYRLILQRQSGSGPLPVQWQIAGRGGEAVIDENWIEVGEE